MPKSEPISAEDVNIALSVIGRHRCRLRKETAELDKVIAIEKKRYAPRLARLRATVKEKEDALRERCEASRRTLLADGKKTLKLMFGALSWRKRPAAVQLQKGVSAEDAAARLVGAGGDGLVRTITVLDKDAIKAAWELDEVSAAVLANAGLRVAPGFDRLAISYDEIKIMEAVDAAAAGK